VSRTTRSATLDLVSDSSPAQCLYFIETSLSQFLTSLRLASSFPTTIKCLPILLHAYPPVSLLFVLKHTSYSRYASRSRFGARSKTAMPRNNDNKQPKPSFMLVVTINSASSASNSGNVILHYSSSNGLKVIARENRPVSSRDFFFSARPMLLSAKTARVHGST
jgi:hypothetical protein